MTHTAKHTPGPWVLQPIRDGEKVIRYSIWKEPTESPEDVVGSAYSLPNAHLIAAAPAMYEALRALVEVFPSVVKMTPYGVPMNISKIHDNAVAALAQAEGHQHG